jgi:hypothetical protein
LENLLYGEYHQFYLKYQEKFTAHPFWRGQGPPPPMGGLPLAVRQRIRTMLAELKTLANKKDVPYQSLAKVYLARQIALERGSLSRSPRKRETTGPMPAKVRQQVHHKI